VLVQRQGDSRNCPKKKIIHNERVDERKCKERKRCKVVQDIISCLKYGLSFVIISPLSSTYLEPCSFFSCINDLRLLQKINSPEKADFLFKFHLMLLDVNGNEILRACGKFWVHLGRMILRY